ncbi:retrovirus-related pol polyprotein from transposon TNT 1-94 [Tanacetum coccineum]
MNQTQRANNSIKNDTLAALYGKYNYEEGLIDQIYKSDSTRFTLQGSKALISNPSMQENDFDIEEDQRSNSEFLADLNAEFHERALLANQRRFYKRSGRVGYQKKPIDKTNETCFACGKLGHFQKECPTLKTSTPSYPSSSKTYNKPKFYTNTTPQHNQIINNNQKDYRVKYKGLKAEIAVLTKKIDAMNKGKSEKGLVAESFDWDEESVSSDDESVTTFKALMALADEPSIGKADARLGQWVEITMSKALNSSFQNEITKLSLENESLKDEISDLNKVIGKWTSSRVTLDQLLSEHVPGNIVMALGGTGKRKEKGSSKEIVFTKSDVSTNENNPELPSDLESDDNTHIPLPSLPKLIGAEPSGITKCLTITKPKQSTDNVVPVKGLKEPIQTQLETSPTSQSGSSRSVKGKDKIWYGPCKYCGLKNHLSEDCYENPKCSTCGSSDHLTKEHPEQIMVKRTLAKLHTHPSHGSSRKAPMIPKPYIPCKYCGFNDHHSDEYEFYPGCDLCGSIAHETSDCPKKTSQGKPRIALKQSSEPTANGCSRHMTGVKQYLHRYSKESGPKVVFGDNSSGDTEGYGSVNCNGITFTKGTIFNQNQEVVLIAPRRRDVYVIDMTSYNEESNACFFAKASPSVNWLWHKRLSHFNF